MKNFKKIGEQVSYHYKGFDETGTVEFIINQGDNTIIQITNDDNGQLHNVLPDAIYEE